MYGFPPSSKLKDSYKYLNIFFTAIYKYIVDKTGHKWS